MELTKYIYTNKKSLSEEISSEIIDLYNSDAKKEFNNKLTFDIFDKNNICKLLIKEIEKNVKNYTRHLNKNSVINLANFNELKLEKMIIQMYPKNEIMNEYKHEDLDNNEVKVFSKLIFLWYLNDVEEGGETEFWQGEYKIKPEVGKMIIFPDCWTFPHCEKIPLSCNKYILTGRLLNN